MTGQIDYIDSNPSEEVFPCLPSRSDLEVFLPPGPIVLPNGAVVSAVETETWANVKRRRQTAQR